jgi:outer membrane protein
LKRLRVGPAGHVPVSERIMKKGEGEMFTRRISMIIGIFIIGGWLGSGFAADLKIGTVDIQKAINECNAGKEAKKEITKDFEKFQRTIAEKQKELQTLKESLEKQAPMLSQDARVTKEKELQNKYREFQRWGEDSENEIKQKRTDRERKIVIELQKVIQKVGADEGFTLVFEKNENIVLYSSKSIDLTDRVIKVFDIQKK